MRARIVISTLLLVSIAPAPTAASPSLAALSLHPRDLPGIFRMSQGGYVRPGQHGATRAYYIDLVGAPGGWLGRVSQVGDSIIMYSSARAATAVIVVRGADIPGVHLGTHLNGHISLKLEYDSPSYDAFGDLGFIEGRYSVTVTAAYRFAQSLPEAQGILSPILIRLGRIIDRRILHAT